MNCNELYKIGKKTIADKSPITYKNTKRGIGKMLLIVRTYEKTLLTVRQYIDAIVEHSKFSVDVVDVSKAFPVMSKRERSKYDVIVLHDTVTIPGGYLLNLLGEVFFKSYDGIKVVIKQDEHNRTNQVIDFLKKYSVDLLLSIWDEETADYVYRGKNPNLRIMANCLTGYIPVEYKTLNYSLHHRPIGVGYRGTPFVPILGRLGYEKDHIGDMFLEHTKDRNIRTDISSRFEDRIYGDKWLDYLGSCKFQLGVESGTDIVDLDGTIRKMHDKKIGKYVSDEEKLAFMETIGSKLHYRAISPRHFEAIACRSVQILLEGTYQGIMEPYRHYVPLKRDLSNINEVIAYIHDDERRKEIANRAYEEIIFVDDYSYSKFVERMDQNIICIKSGKTR